MHPAAKAAMRSVVPSIGNIMGQKHDLLPPAGRIDMPPELFQKSNLRAHMDDIVYEEVREAPVWMRPVVALTHACSIKQSSRLFRYLLEKGWRAEEIFYAAYHAADSQGSHLTCLASILLLCPLSTRFVHMPVIEHFEDESASDQDVVLDTYLRRPVPAECIAKAKHDDPDAPTDAEIQRDATSLWEAISTATGSLSHSMLRIRMAREKDFAEMGLTEREASALCGYVEGIRASRTHAMMGTLYMPTAPNRKPLKLPTGPMDARSTEPAAPVPDEASIRAEYEGRITAAQAMADRASSELDRTATELRRSRKAASHEIADANSRIDELETKLSELEDQLRKARSENARLSQSVLDLTLDQPDNDDQPDEDGSGLPDWPCSVGADCTIRFYGGHENFLAEMTRRFPNVEFSPAWKMPNTDGIAGADLIFINTRSMKHKMWYSLQKAINKSNQDYILCPTRGANACSRLILDSYTAWKAELEETGAARG